MPITTAVQFYLDPVCPWTWITSRWLVEVADHRDLQITWNQYSLRYHNKTNPAYDWLREEMEDQYPGMRVVAATKQHHGNAAAGRLNTTLGTLIHHDGDDRLARLAEGIAAAGLLADLIEARLRCRLGRGHHRVDRSGRRPRRQRRRHPDRGDRRRRAHLLRPGTGADG